MVDKNELIRYSGSPVALSFSEAKDNKEVLLLEVKDNKLQSINPLPVPAFRRLIKISGTAEEVKQKINVFAKEKNEPKHFKHNSIYCTVTHTLCYNLTCTYVQHLRFSSFIIHYIAVLLTYYRSAA